MKFLKRTKRTMKGRCRKAKIYRKKKKHRASNLTNLYL